MQPISLTTMPRASGRKTVSQDEGFMGPVSRFWNRSYTADYVGFALLLLAYSLVGLAKTRIGVSRLTFSQIEVLVEPFHRMFSLDNISIQYPHAAVERVPASMQPSKLPCFTFQLICRCSMERRLLCLSPTMRIPPMGHHIPTWSTQDECYNTGSCYQHHADYIPYGRG